MLYALCPSLNKSNVRITTIIQTMSPGRSVWRSERRDERKEGERQKRNCLLSFMAAADMHTQQQRPTSFFVYFTNVMRCDAMTMKNFIEKYSEMGRRGCWCVRAYVVVDVVMPYQVFLLFFPTSGFYFSRLDRTEPTFCLLHPDRHARILWSSPSE